MKLQTQPAPRRAPTDLPLDVHVKPETGSDKVAFAFVKFLRFFADKFFAKR